MNDENEGDGPDAVSDSGDLVDISTNEPQSVGSHPEDHIEIPIESKSEEGDDGDEDDITDEEKIANLQARRDRLVRQEEFLLNLDRLFLSDGLRLLIILPSVGTAL